MDKITEAVKCLKQGLVIIYPSESCYSFGCDAKNKAAVERVHEIKQEEKTKAFILNVFDITQAKEFGIINDSARELCKKFMPGALTLIVDKKEECGYLSQEGIAFRILSNEIAQQLVKEFGSAIITTSVNIHGDPPLYDITAVKQQFGKKVDCIIDVGDLNKEVNQSTVFDTRTNKVLREGALPSQELYDFLNNLRT